MSLERGKNTREPEGRGRVSEEGDLKGEEWAKDEETWRNHGHEMCLKGKNRKQGGERGWRRWLSKQGVY